MFNSRCMPVTLILVLLSSQSVAAGTFSGVLPNASFRVREYIDSVTTTVEKTGPVSFTLTTDYSQIEWTATFDVDLLMAGGPGQPFETRLRAQGSFTTDAPSPLSFPNVKGTSNAGEFSLLGSAEWELSQRIVTATNTRQHGPEDLTLNTSGRPHYFNVLNYPTSVNLTANIDNGSYRSIGLLGSTANGVSVEIAFQSASSVSGEFGTPVTLTEILAGDFNGSGAVDAGDYTTWRDSTGVVAPLLTSYGTWVSNYGNAIGSASISGNVPEPSTGILFLAFVCLSGQRPPGRERNWSTR